MANLNKVMLIGRLTRDPEVIPFQNGGKVAKLGFVVNYRKFNSQTQQWEDKPVWLDVKMFNRGENGKMADRAESLRKGQQIFVEGHLVMEEWTDKEGQNRNKIVVYADNFQYLERREDGGYGGDGASMGGGRPAQQRNTGGGRSPAPARTGGGYNNGNAGPSEEDSFGSGGGTDDDIPF